MEDQLFLQFLGKCLKYWENRDVLYAHRPKTLFLFLMVNKFSMELNRCLCNILVNELFLELNQSVNDHKDLMLHLDTTISIVILRPSC